MGYLTTFSLEIIEGDSKTNHIAGIGEISGYGEQWEGDSIKWYNCDKDMLKYSKLYPDTVFEITGYGEEQEDIWKAYYKDGKEQKTVAKIIFDDYDEFKLK